MSSSDDAAAFSDEDTLAARGPQTHSASGLMPAQNDAVLDEVAPDRAETTDAFGRTRDER